MSGEVHSSNSGVTPQSPISGPAAGPPATVSASPTATGPTGPTNDQAQESPQTKFANSQGYTVHPPSFSYNLSAKTDTVSGTSQQFPTTPAPKFTPPASAAALQPPIPGPSAAVRPSFSYNIIPQVNVSSSSDQKLQSSIAINPGHVQGGNFKPPTTATLQPSVPGQPGYSNPTVSRSGAPSMPSAAQSTFFVPNGQASVSMGYSFNGSSHSPAGVEASPQNITSNTIYAQESVNTPLYARPLPMMPRGPGMQGPPGIPPSVNQIAIDTSLRPMPYTASTVTENSQLQLYPPHPSLPAMTPPPQALWLHPTPVGGLQRPFIPYQGVLPGPFPMPIRGMPVPSVPLSDSRPPGVSLIGPPGGPVQFTNSLGEQSPPPGIDLDKQANDLANKDGGSSKKEDMDAWTAHKTETGVVYYYNALTGESTYEKPVNFTGEPDKVTAQPTPVSWEKLAGTDWTLITTNDSKKYYHNTKSKVSSWQVPSEVAELRKKQESDSVSANAPVQNPTILADKGSAPAITTGGRDATPLRPSGVPMSSALDLVKKKLQDAGTIPSASPLPVSSTAIASDLNGTRSTEVVSKGQHSENSRDKVKDANGDVNLSDSSSDSDDVDSGPTKEECIVQFKEMLKERGVAPFSKWDKELPKILFDPRFKAIPSYSARRAIFEHYVRTRAEEERKEKRAAQKAAIEAFKQLLDEASEDIDHKTDYQTFKRKWGNDPRFDALDRKDRELLLNEKVLPLKKALEEKRIAAATTFKTMLRDKGEITKNSRWSRVKDSLRDDPRYKSVKHEDREILFNQYISQLKAAEDEAERASKAKRDEQDKLKERERETRKRKEREEQEMERVRLKVRRKEAITSYQALLVETIKDPKASWTESKPRLEKDPQGRATNSDLDKADIEKLFREHVKSLYERSAHEFRTLLAEVITAERAAQVMEHGKTVLTSWSTAKPLLKPDPRYSKIHRKERESLWHRYADEMQRKLKSTSHPTGERQNMEYLNKTPDSVRYSPQVARRTHGSR